LKNQISMNDSGESPKYYFGFSKLAIFTWLHIFAPIMLYLQDHFQGNLFMDELVISSNHTMPRYAHECRFLLHTCMWSAYQNVYFSQFLLISLARSKIGLGMEGRLQQAAQRGI
jgi:hypothetical protein